MDRRLLLVASVLFLAPATVARVCADEKGPTTYAEAAAAVRQAAEAEDRERIRALATDAFDPWIVADHLRVGGHHAVAAAYGRAAARRPAGVGLPAYLATHRDSAVAPRVHARLVEAAQALGRGELDAALTTVGEAPPTDVGTIRLAYVRAHVLKRRREFQRALDIAYAAMEAAARIGWAAYEGKVAFWCGLERLGRGEFADAARDFERSMHALRRAGRLGTANDAMNALGVARKNLGQYGQALALYEEGLAVAVQRGDKKAQANALNNIGVIHERLDSYTKALDYYERSLVIERELGREDGIAGAFVNMANVFSDRGDYARSLTLFEQALAIEERLEDPGAIAETLNNMASTYRLLGRAADARAAYERALAIHRQRENWNGMATVQVNLGHLAHEALDIETEIGHYRAALDILEKRPDVAMQIAVHASLGRAHDAAGRADEARRHFGLAREGAEAIGDRASFAQVGFSEGLLAFDQGRLDEGEAAIREAIDSFRALGMREWEVRALVGLAQIQLARAQSKQAMASSRRAIELAGPLLGGLGDAEAAAARDRRHSFFDVGIRSALAAGSTADLLFFLEHGRAGALAAALRARETLREVLVPAPLRAEEARAEREVAAATRVLRRALASGKRKVARARREDLNAARSRWNDVALRIQRRGNGTDDFIHPEPVDMPTLQSRLRPDDALVLFALTTKDVAALVVRRDGAAIRRLGAQAEVGAAIRTFAPRDTEVDPAAAAEAVARLRALVLEPLGLGTDVRRLLISPEDELAYVPFGLLDPSREIVYVPSATTLSLLLRARPQGSRDVLAVGDPDYGARKLPRLLATRVEARAVGTRVLLGKDATEGRFCAAVARRPWRALHLACHGLLDTERPLFSGVALTQTDADDGMLTVLDVFKKNVRADLVVLSACDTARGRLYRAEGIVGLTRAFMYAGAPRVLCSLWKVDDEATRALMTRFYALYNPPQGRGVDAATALRQAQAFVRSHERWKHPTYWAAWVLWGLP